MTSLPASQQVAIDGPAGSGKSAVGRRVAAELGLPFIDSGILYRAVALVALQRGTDTSTAKADCLARLAERLRLELLPDRLAIDGLEVGPALYTPDVSEAASRVAEVPQVRAALLPQLRRLARSGAVMAGRDIGTVVLPEARHKFFLNASVEERVRRRQLQQHGRGLRPDAAALRREIEDRDRRDRERSSSPLKVAHDAQALNTDRLDLDQVVSSILSSVRRS
ncbi:MAG: (d)CMP kinase [Candidatus Dormibacteraeota bacterium]|uniref:Cytidylate kinase n=1 Tax=Candidatus Dormiibacter inghamiae TaxID=3127013 RepID=A0A934KIY3_9BACT|nr:(d)CMP kinase [Candidatus Dormibacteraeota bacterium]MBJ7607470.1 (d)CMP kinase [Candidatus Dormibacteraeota bacterium]